MPKDVVSQTTYYDIQHQVKHQWNDNTNRYHWTSTIRRRRILSYNYYYYRHLHTFRWNVSNKRYKSRSNSYGKRTLRHSDCYGRIWNNFRWWFIFVNDLVTELLNLLRTEHKTTLAYSKEENAIVKQINKEIMRH